MKNCELCGINFNPKRITMKYCSKVCSTKHYYLKNKDKQKETAYMWRKKNPHKNRRIDKNTKLKRSYGITLDDYESLSKHQNDKCAICNKEEVGKRLAVDHCHATGKIRGLLCQKCNRALGMFQDDTKIIKNAINYLKGNDYD